MFLVAGAYADAHGLTREEFLSLDRQHRVLNYVAECPDVFDAMTPGEMVKEIDAYVGGV